jgi:hypothetical protein
MILPTWIGTAPSSRPPAVRAGRCSVVPGKDQYQGCDPTQEDKIPLIIEEVKQND